MDEQGEPYDIVERTIQFALNIVRLCQECELKAESLLSDGVRVLPSDFSFCLVQRRRQSGVCLLRGVGSAEWGESC